MPHDEDPVLRWAIDPRIAAGVSTRRGGVSTSPYASLNWSYAVGDDPERVAENRRRALGALGLNPAQLAVAGQVHGAALARVGASEAGGRPVPGVDGLYTSEAGTAVAVAVADCVPVLLAAPDHGWVAAVHAGWRGTAQGIARRAVEALVAEGVPASAIWAAIGPSIGPCCYEVDAPVWEAMTAAFGSDRMLVPNRPGHWRLDLWLANQMALEAAGILPGHIELLGWCTACHPEWFFSYRRDGARSGRMGGFICRLP
ncbi:MAG: peptidoglycan editing factor PgeF [Firmicutes bacterium]|nr:peptidoglycan editing factor PgeF [Alicyclobacillaceae bacterium]MCL6497750.1 peptidoglycan editing factor PgeF [Bacillota bacterium]